MDNLGDSDLSLPPPCLPYTSNNAHSSTRQQNESNNFHLPETDCANSEPYINLTSFADNERQPVTIIYDRRQECHSLATSATALNDSNAQWQGNNNNRLQKFAHRSRPELDRVGELGNGPESFSYTTLEQTASTHHSEQTHNSVEEHSPYGSPGSKFEEIVLNCSPYDANKPHYRQRIKSRAHSYDVTTYQERLSTFFDWTSTAVDKEALAKAGFFYEGFGDQVYCFKCRAMLHRWKPGDDPKTEHLKHCKRHCI